MSPSFEHDARELVRSAVEFLREFPERADEMRAVFASEAEDGGAPEAAAELWVRLKPHLDAADRAAS